VVLPLASLSWLENGGEFRRTAWSFPPERELVPNVATFGQDPQQSELVREFAAEPSPLPTPTGAARREDGIPTTAPSEDLILDIVSVPPAFDALPAWPVGGAVEPDEPAGNLDWLLDARTKHRARMAPLAIMVLAALVVLTYMMVTH